MRALADALLAVLIASPCAACGEVLERPTAGPVCARCWQSILPVPPPVCDTCGDPLPAWRTISLVRATCARCRRTPRYVDRARAAGLHEGAMRAIVHALKYEGRRSLAAPLGVLMRERGDEVISLAEAAVPVPLHATRRLERGFNQAADLANHLGLPLVAALRRSRRTADQVGLPAGRRHANVRRAFKATDAAAVLANRTVLLVDDVTTTGATLNACAHALKSAGIAEVLALTAARVATNRVR
jgi:ComF family protein